MKPLLQPAKGPEALLRFLQRFSKTPGQKVVARNYNSSPFLQSFSKNQGDSRGFGGTPEELPNHLKSRDIEYLLMKDERHHRIGN